MDNESNFRKVLELSTAHMPSGAEDLESLSIEELTYGWLLYVTDYREMGIPVADWMHRILEEARRHNCGLILFDADAPRYEGLETWDW